MQIRISCRHMTLAIKARKQIEARVALAFGRYADRVRHVLVTFPKAPDGAEGRSRCRIDVSLHKKIRVEAADKDVMAAMDLALDHAARSIDKILKSESINERTLPVAGSPDRD